MLAVQEDFSKRASEVETYFLFVGDIVEGRRHFDPPMDPEMFEQFTKTIKANGYLLLYNLVESTVGNAIEAIFDELRRRGVRFNQCRDEVQQVILANLRRHNVGKIQPRLNDMALHVVTETFRKNELFSGNVDAKKIKETAKDFGFGIPQANGSKLQVVKIARNHLAHGEKSFADVGRDSTHIELEDTKYQVIHYLEKMLESVAEYLDKHRYLNSVELAHIEWCAGRPRAAL
jgi:hypothetical protein